MTLEPLSVDQIGNLLKQAAQLQPGDAFVVVDLAELDTRLDLLRISWPESCLHTIAVKANPLHSILKRVAAKGFGAEVASPGEHALAQRAGFPSELITFDSPVKSQDELQSAAYSGGFLIADSLRELEKIPGNSRAQVGLRINPQVGTGALAYTSTAGVYSKFGVPLSESRSAVIEAFLARPQLTVLHLHVGSQTCMVSMLVEGIARVVELADEINSRAKAQQITTLNIGGGLPTSYRRGIVGPQWSEYRTALEERCPGLFQKFRIVTEFGRHLHANTAFAVSRVEQVKRQGEFATAYIHLGADMFVRECYNPNDWHHDLFVFDSNFNLKEDPEETFYIAGPLCFSGDLLARDVHLPRIEEGDYLVICDVGAYTFSMWSLYNSRVFPAIVGIDRQRAEIIKKRQSLEHLLTFWE